MVPHCAEGGNSLLLRAISSQNKNISFRRKSQINTGFAWSGFYLPKNCYFLAHFIRWMKDVSWELGKMSFMRAHTHPISLILSQSQRAADSPPSPSLSRCLTHVRTTHLCTYTVHTHAGISSCLTEKAFVFRAASRFWHQRGLESHSWLWMSLFDVTTLLCQVFTSMACLPRLISQTKTLKGQWWIT